MFHVVFFLFPIGQITKSTGKKGVFISDEEIDEHYGFI